MMRRPLLTVLGPLLFLAAQAQDPVVQSVLDALRIDSMMRYANELSGEVPVSIAGVPQTILSRHRDNAGNAVSQAYLEQKLVQFGYAPVVQSFSATGKNILVTKTGELYPDQEVVLCAHYDARPGPTGNAPAADDDGSGVCAVLDAARVLRDIPFAYSIVFALWDEEEFGLVGSAFYAGAMAANDELIRGVINMDAIAYDGNGDRKARIHTRSIANSIEVADSVFAVRDHYNIDLDLLLTNPGATYSDHASFWNEGFGAVLVIEEFTADGNPHYHTPTDRVQYFDVPYYEKLAKLSIATAATLAEPVITTSAGVAVTGRAKELVVYPNPSMGDALLGIDMPVSRKANIVILDALGQEVATVHQGHLAAGGHVLALPLMQLAPGGYWVRASWDGANPMMTRIVKVP